ncbi:hypothetical protein [Methylobacterium komagatae]
MKALADAAFASPQAGLYTLAGTTLLGAALILSLRARPRPAPSKAAIAS